MKTRMLLMTVVLGAVGARAVVLNPRLGVYYPTITQAVEAAASGDRLNISTGVYAETVWITNKILTLVGGYATNCTTRIVNAYSVITGSGGVRVRYVRPVVLEWLMITGVTSGIALDVRDSASVTCNYSQIKYNSGALLGHGGGVVVRYGSYALLSNVIVSANSAPQRGGGAAVVGNSTLVLEGWNTEVVGNTAPAGGGVSVEERGTLVVNGAVIHGNTAGQGGGVYVSNSTLVVQGQGGAVGWPEMGYNRATNTAGGGVYAWQSRVIVSNQGMVTKNWSRRDGGGVYADQSYVYFGDAALGVLPSNEANRAEAGAGGGIYLVKSTAVFERARIVGNCAGSGGGVRLAGGAYCVCSNTIVQDNIALYDGGGLLCYWLTNSCVVEGGMIVSNRAMKSGGGLYVDTMFGGAFSGTIRGCVVQDNRGESGGGVRLGGGTLLVENCDLQGNSADYDGGGIKILGGSLRLRNTRARSNMAESGGALCAVSGGGMVDILIGPGGPWTNTFSHNVATNGGAWYLGVMSRVTALGAVELKDNVARHEGGAMYLTNNAELVITCTNGGRMVCAGNVADRNGGALAVHRGAVLDAQGLECMCNRAGQHGGGMFVNGGSVTVHYDQPVTEGTIPANLLHGNVAGERGGGVSAWPASQVQVCESVFLTNSAAYGGGIYAEYAKVRLINTLMVSNHALMNGPQAFATQTSAVSVVHSTFAQANQAMALFYAAQLAATNSIFWALYSPFFVAYGATAVVCYCDVKEGWPGEGNISVDPRFVDPAQMNYQLAADSPCINMGINAGVSYDCVGAERPYGGGYDLGAYEFVPEPGGLAVAVLFTIYKLQVTSCRRRGRIK